MLLAIFVVSLYHQLKSSSIRGIHPDAIHNVFVYWAVEVQRLCIKPRLRELFNCPSFSDSLLRARERFNWRVGVSKLFAAHRADRNEIAMMSPWYCRRRSHITSAVRSMLSRTGNVTATGSTGNRNDIPASLHCSVNLRVISRDTIFLLLLYEVCHCDKNVIRSSTKHHHQHPSSASSFASAHRTLFFRDVGYTPSLYGPQSAAHVLSEILFSCCGHRRDCQRILRPEGI